jgi:putative tricarboxylic transport membrane protein
MGGCALVLLALVVQRRAGPAEAGPHVKPGTAHVVGTAHVAIPYDRWAVLRVGAGLAAFVALLDVAGFIAAGTVMFATTASAFGSRRWLRDALAGAAFCAGVYVAFTRGLGVPLP